MLNKLSKAIKQDGVYVFIFDRFNRAATRFRSAMVGRKLGAERLVLGPRCTLRGLRYMTVGNEFHAGEGLWLEAISSYEGKVHSPRIIIGNNVTVSKWTHIAAANRVEIGDGVLIGSKVLISDHNHGTYAGFDCASPMIAPSLRPLNHDKTTVIGRNVWLGDGVVVTPGANIGEGCVIGANAVVRGVIPPFSIAGGVPARLIKTFNFETGTWDTPKQDRTLRLS